MQTALVAGGAGFIGSHLCGSLLKDNFFVLCVDNLITGDKKNIEEFLDNPNFKFIERDITKALSLQEKINFIFHLASPASPNMHNPKSYINKPTETLLANSLGTYNLLELALRGKSRFLYTSSSEVYGDPQVSPQSESYWGNVNPNGVRSVYDEGKRFSEAMIASYVRVYGLDARIIRIFNTYGPKMAEDGRVVPNFIAQSLSGKPITVYGDGKQTRSLCFIEDMVDGLVKAIFAQIKGEVVNLGNPNEMTILELANLINKLTGSNSEIVFEKFPPDDPKKRRPDISKANKLLGWKPKVGLEEGLKKTIEYFKSK